MKYVDCIRRTVIRIVQYQWSTRHINLLPYTLFYKCNRVSAFPGIRSENIFRHIEQGIENEWCKRLSAAHDRVRLTMPASIRALLAP
jgi:hypothetical protein